MVRTVEGETIFWTVLVTSGIEACATATGTGCSRVMNSSIAQTIRRQTRMGMA
jgi:hypothetical protein